MVNVEESRKDKVVSSKDFGAVGSIWAFRESYKRSEGRRRPRRLKPSLALSLIQLPGPDRFRCWPSEVQCSQICGSGVRNMSCDFEAMFGEIVGKGSQATVYAKGEHAVKLYREGYPKRNVFIEAYIMANLELVNFPGPRIYEILLVNGRYGLRMDRVKGEMMSEEFRDPARRDPARCKDTLDALVTLQCRLQKQKYDKVWWMSDLKQRFHDDLVNNDRLSAPGSDAEFPRA